MGKSLQQFLLKKLRIPPEGISQDQIEDIKRCRLARNDRQKMECIVAFKTVDIRDFVASHSRNLADYVDQENNPTASIN